MSYITQEKNSTIIKGHGIAFEILNTLSEKFGFTYDVFVPARRTLMNEKGGILHMLTQGVSLISWLSNTYCYLFKWSNCHSYSILYHPLFLLPSTHAQPIWTFHWFLLHVCFNLNWSILLISDTLSGESSQDKLNPVPLHYHHYFPFLYMNWNFNHIIISI